MQSCAPNAASTSQPRIGAAATHKSTPCKRATALAPPPTPPAKSDSLHNHGHTLALTAMSFFFISGVVMAAGSHSPQLDSYVRFRGVRGCAGAACLLPANSCECLLSLASLAGGAVALLRRNSARNL